MNEGDVGGVTDISTSRYRWVVALLSALLASFSLVWALVLPAFSGPDELRHYNSVVRVLDGGGWPKPYSAKLLDSTLTAYYESGMEYIGQKLEEIPEPADRSSVLSGVHWENTVHDQMVQHPPAYYYLLAGAISLADEQTLRWDHAQLAMRVLSGFLVAAAVPFLVGIARWMTGSRLMGLVGGGFVFFVPFFSNAAGHISNDALLILTCTVALYGAVRAAVDARPRWLLLAGAALGVALLTKGFALMLVPVIAAFALITAVRAGSAFVRGASIVLLPLAVAFAIGGWWWLRNLLVLGKLQPSILGNRERPTEVHPDYDLATFVTSVVRRLNRTFWGRGARLEIALPETPVLIAGLLLVVVVVAALIVARRRLLLVLLFAFPALILATTLANAHDIFWDTGNPSRGVQGRYVFAGIAALTTSVAIVTQALVGRRRVKWQTIAVAAYIAVGALVTGGALLWVLRSLASAEGVTAFILATDVRHGVPPGVLVGAVVVCALVAGAAVALVLASGRRGDQVGQGRTGPDRKVEAAPPPIIEEAHPDTSETPGGRP